MRNEIATAPNSRFGLPKLAIISTFQSTNGRDRNPTVGRVRVPGESTSHVLSRARDRPTLRRDKPEPRRFLIRRGNSHLERVQLT